MFDPEYGELPDRLFAPPSDDEQHGIPGGLDHVEPGIILATVLESVDVDRLSGRDRVTYLRAQQRMASHYKAGVYRSMAAVTEHMREDEEDYAAAAEAAESEIQVALRLTRRAAQADLALALELHERLPRVADALSAGVIDVRRAKTIVRYTTHLPIAAARTVVDEIIENAPRLTTGQLAARLKRLCIEADPELARDRYRHAENQRRVVTEATVDGTTHLHALDLPPDAAARAMRRIHHLATQLRRDGDTRTMDQLRTDVFLDLLEGRNNGAKGPRGVVDIHVDLDTLAGLADRPGDLGGYGPVIADIARRIADDSPDAEWRYTVTDQTSGQPLATGTTRRRPTAGQRRAVETRDRTCVFPGCRAPATACDIDHTTRYADGGTTSVDNSAPLCRPHHTRRHRHGWAYRRLPDGDYEWTTKLGHVYKTSGRSP